MAGSRPASLPPPAAVHAKRRKTLAAGIAEVNRKALQAERQGVPLHKLIPVH